MIKAAGIMYVAPSGFVLLCKRKDTGEWAFPGGCIEKGETAEQAAKRESKEEIDYEPGRLKFLTRRVKDGVDFTTFQGHCYEEFKPKLNHEHSAFVWADPGALLEDAGVPFRNDAGKWNEADHPRGPDGKFTGGAGGKMMLTATKIGGKLGSNEGGVYESSNGSKFYAKFYKKPAQAKVEALAGKVSKAMGVETLRPKVAEVNGHDALVTPWDPNTQALGLTGLKDVALGNMGVDAQEQLAKVFAAGVLTENWDVVGLGGDNIGIDADGNLVMLDMGGAFDFRAQGESKPYKGDIDVFDTLQDPQYPAGQVFSELLKHPEALDTIETTLLSKYDELTNVDFEGNNALSQAYHQRFYKLLEKVQALKAEQGDNTADIPYPEPDEPEDEDENPWGTPQAVATALAGLPAHAPAPAAPGEVGGDKLQLLKTKWNQYDKASAAKSKAKKAGDLDAAENWDMTLKTLGAEMKALKGETGIKTWNDLKAALGGGAPAPAATPAPKPAAPAPAPAQAAPGDEKAEALKSKALLSNSPDLAPEFGKEYGDWKAFKHVPTGKSVFLNMDSGFFQMFSESDPSNAIEGKTAAELEQALNSQAPTPAPAAAPAASTIKPIAAKNLAQSAYDQAEAKGADFSQKFNELMASEGAYEHSKNPAAYAPKLDAFVHAFDAMGAKVQDLKDIIDQHGASLPLSKKNAFQKQIDTIGDIGDKIIAFKQSKTDIAAAIANNQLDPTGTAVKNAKTQGMVAKQELQSAMAAAVKGKVLPPATAPTPAPSNPYAANATAAQQASTAAAAAAAAKAAAGPQLGGYKTPTRSLPYDFSSTLDKAGVTDAAARKKAEDFFKTSSVSPQYFETAAAKMNKPLYKKHKVSFPEAAAIAGYTGGNYRALNEASRAGAMTPAQYHMAKYLDKGLAKLPNHVGIVKRGFTANSEEMKSLDRYQVNKVVEDYAVVSSGKGEGWSGNVKMILHSKTGKDVSTVSSSGAHEGGGEVAFRTNSRFYVLRREQKGGVLEIELEEVDWHEDED